MPLTPESLAEELHEAARESKLDPIASWEALDDRTKLMYRHMASMLLNGLCVTSKLDLSQFTHRMVVEVAVEAPSGEVTLACLLAHKLEELASSLRDVAKLKVQGAVALPTHGAINSSHAEGSLNYHIEVLPQSSGQKSREVGWDPMPKCEHD